jgi:leader peptidase (prepilin peptidase)/N-methyltransferase
MISHASARRGVTLVSPRSTTFHLRLAAHLPKRPGARMHLVFPIAAAVVAAACGWPASKLVVALSTAAPTDAAERDAASAGAAPGPRSGLLEILATSLLLAALAFGIALRLHPAAVALAGCWVAACGVPMAIIDARQRRLPDALTGTCLAGTAACLTAAAASSGDWLALGRAGLGALVVATFFALLGVARPGSAGLGDAKLGLSTGALAAWFGWTVLLAALFAAFVLAACYALWLLASGRASFRGGSVPFGPFLLAGCLLAVAVLPLQG